MIDDDKTKEHLIKELAQLRQRITELKASEAEHKRVEEALRESKERYRRMVENANESIVVAQDGMLRFVNPKAIELTGYSQDELTSRPFVEFIHPDDRKLVFERHIKRLEGDELPQVYSFRIIDKNGNIKWVEINVALIKWEVRPATLFFLSDVTERKRAEEAMKVKDNAIDSSINGHAIVDLEGNLAYVNNSFLKMWGYNDERDVLGKPAVQFWQSEEKAWEIIEVLRERGSWIGELVAKRKDGSLFDTQLSVNTVTDDDDNPICMLGSFVDITERKKAEEQIKDYAENLEKMVEERTKALKESEEKLQAILMGIGDLITIQNRDLDIIWINQAERDIYGDVIGRKCYEAYKGLTAPCTNCTVEQVFNEGKALVTEGMVIRPDGRSIHILTTSAPMKDAEGNIIAVVETVKDITERKELDRQLEDYTENLEKIAEERTKALRESEEKQKAILRGIGDLITIHNRDLDIIWANQPIRDIWGDVLREKCYKVYKGLDAPCPECTVEAVFTEGRTFVTEQSVIKADGNRMNTLVTSAPMKDAKGNIIAVVETVKDITERKQAEMALREAEAKYRTLVEQSLQGLIISQDGRIVFANQALAKITGYTVEELLALSPEKVMQIIHPEDQSLVWGRMRDRLQGKSVPNRYEYRGIRKDGSVVWLEMFSNLIEYSGKPAVQAVVADITEKLKIEEEILKMQKLESLGILAGGIAHDFNNILTAILGNISVAKLSVKPGDTVFNRLTEAEKASMRAKDLTQQLLTFSKGGIPIKKTTSLAEVLKDTATFTLSGSSVECKFTIQEDIWPVEVDEGQISQVIRNLIINADQAMPEGGMIEVSAENITIGIEAALPLQEGNYVKILIKDQGIGIPKDHLSKIFDPYFSTKQKGSGLGLTVAYSIIKNHEGYITVYSELGVGTTFSIYLPASKKQILPEKIKEEKPIIGKGKILVMDDEEIIRDALDEILTTLEYQVGFAKNGEEAIALYKQAKEINEPFHAVIMDLTIRGGMGGKEAIKKLLEIDPNVKAIVSSGYSTDPVMADHQKYGFSGVVAKPYDIMELSETLHKVITKKNEK